MKDKTTKKGVCEERARRRLRQEDHKKLDYTARPCVCNRVVVGFCVFPHLHRSVLVHIEIRGAQRGGVECLYCV